MYQVTVTCSFLTMTEEQARYIRQFFDDAAGLMSCESSSFAASDVMETPTAEPGVYQIKSLVVDTLDQAEQVKAKLQQLVSQVGFVSVQDLYDLVGIPGSYADSKWGWRNIDGFKCTPSGTPTGVAGYKIQMPSPRLL